MVSDSGDPVPGVWRFGGQESADLQGERGWNSLVGVEGKNPVVAGETGSEILLINVPGPCSRLSSCAFCPGDGDGAVSAAGVNDDDFVGPGSAVDGVSDMCGFVERDDCDRDTRHGADVIARPRSARLRSRPR